MNYQFPHTIENSIGEKIIFKSVEPSTGGDKAIVESFCKPGGGPPMHTHFKQDECITVVSGKMGYEISGEEPKIATAGETVLFKRGIPHKFWVVGEDNLHCKGYVQPVNTVIFFFIIVRLTYLTLCRSRPHPQPPLQRRWGLEPSAIKSFKGFDKIYPDNNDFFYQLCLLLKINQAKENLKFLTGHTSLQNMQANMIWLKYHHSLKKLFYPSLVSSEGFWVNTNTLKMRRRR